MLPILEGVGAAPAADGGLVRILDARRMETAAGLFDEFQRALEFPDYFGHNWDALDECVCDLEWLPASSYRVVIESAPLLLDRDRAARPIFVSVMANAGKEWATTRRVGQSPGRSIPFNTVLLGALTDWFP